MYDAVLCTHAPTLCCIGSPLRQWQHVQGLIFWSVTTFTRIQADVFYNSPQSKTYVSLDSWLGPINTISATSSAIVKVPFSGHWRGYSALKIVVAALKGTGS